MWENVQGLRSTNWALAGVTQWIESRSVTQNVMGSIAGQGTCLGCRPDLLVGVCEKQPIISLTHRCFSPCLSPPLL